VRETPVRGMTNTWLTPPEIIRSLGEFDLDPACPPDMPWSTAATMYTEYDNGLMQPWEGRVWLNPPYGKEADNWLDRLALHGNGIALTFVRSETSSFFRNVWNKADAIFFFRGRISFYTPDGRVAGTSAAPSCLIAYGERNVEAIAKSGIKGKLVRLK
jgi:hypothetical protein